jgi:biopolymer transport protein ExbB/biopolymer transport protein TolQ
MPFHSDAEVIEAVTRSSTRSAAVAHLKMKRGLDSLASIAATAPFVGLLGTVLGIANAYGGSGTGNKWTIFAALNSEIADSLTLTAFGLLVAIIASCFYTYLSNKMETLDLEMRNASLNLVNQLTLLR